MKNNYLKTLAVILIGIVSFSITTDVSAGKCNGTELEGDQICVYLQKGKKVQLENDTSSDEFQSSRLAATHKMIVKIGGDDPKTEGDSYKAYCAWYENEAPDTGYYTVEPISLDNKNVAIGLDSIISTDLIAEGFDDLAERIIKTTAINLFLTLNEELAGKTCIPDNHKDKSNRFDDGAWITSTFYQENGNSPYNIFMTFLYSGNKYERRVATLVEKAQEITDNYVQPTIKFVNDDSQYQLKGGYYQKTYKVTTNNVDTNTLSAEVEGLTDEDKKQVKFSISGTSITVKIPRNIYEKVENKKISITVNADATYNEPKIYVIGGEGDRCKYQDLVFVNYNVKKLKVSTKDVIRLNRCVTYETTCTSTTCKNTNSNNKRTCRSYTKVTFKPTCDSKDDSVKESGKKVADLIAGTCSLYCKEKSSIYYPGNVSPAVNMYTHFSWPTPGTDSKYSLYTESKLTCTIEMNNGGAVTKACINKAKGVEYKNGSDTATLIYDDTKTDNEIKLKQSCVTKTSFNEDTQKIEINNICSYALPSNKNIGVSKKTIGFVDDVKVSEAGNTINSILINKYHGVLPIGGIKGYINFNDTKAANLFKQKYDLQINNMPLGYLGQFTEQVNSNQYVCKYQITDEAFVGCPCPPGTKHVGLDVTDKIENINKNTKTCAEAIEIYCNSDMEEYCYKDGEKIKITDCLDQGNNRAVCESQLCGIPISPLTCETIDGEIRSITTCVFEDKRTIEDCSKEKCPPLVCPPGSDQAGEEYWPCGLETKEACKSAICYAKCDGGNCLCPEGTYYAGKDIETCIYTKMAEGKKFDDAKKTCVEEDCNEGVSDKIIYRTISLENPFPGKNANGTSGDFNDDVKGRIPGANWNSTILVKNKILNNRGYDGSAIYQEADPLYVIELDATAIKKIREYNKAQVKSGGYADFTLNCTDGAYCRSNFLRNIGENIDIKKADDTAILTGGTCKDALTKILFESCYTSK